MSEINVSIIDQKTLRIEEDAKKGDIIDLEKITSIDNSYLLSLIEKEKNTHINKLIEDAIKNKENELKAQYIDELKNKDISIETLKKEIDSLNKTKENDIKIKENEISNHLKEEYQIILKEKEDEYLKIKEELALLKSNESSKIENEKLNLRLSLEKEINDLKKENDSLKKDKENSISLLKLQFENEFNKKIKEKDDQIAFQSSEINRLNLNKGFQNSKTLGEKLERWANEEYQNYSLSGFNNCKFYKDNIAIKEEDETRGTKADFIFESYADSSFKKEELLTSVCLEMKNESNVSTNKKNNSDHYAKLDKDRNKKNCEYALLVSELEWNDENDAPIKKVIGYENMYVVRPPYFITFLSLVNVLALKYREILLKANKENIEFEEKQNIIDEFNKLKATYLESYTEKINKKIIAIKDNAERIISTANLIINDANKVINDYILEIKNKVDRFDIIKISKKIDKLEK